MIVRRSTVVPLCGLLWLLAPGGGSARGQQRSPAKEEPPIQDNSFLVEEAYNQERGVVQHISTFSRMWNSRDWTFSFTQEWPGPRNGRHQFGYSIVGAHAGEFGGAGIGDAIFNYRYQLLGSGDSRVAVAPRLSVSFPTGNPDKGRGMGGTGVQTNLPVSVALTRRIVTHWNVGGTFIPNARNDANERAASAGYNLSQSVIFLASPRVNLMLENAFNAFQAVTGPRTTEWTRTQYLSPGVRWAYNFKSGLQIVPGAALPVGVGPSAGELGIFLYLSFEHPIRRSGER